MPWRKTCAMDERMRFIIAASEDEAAMSELCAEFGISLPDRRDAERTFAAARLGDRRPPLRFGVEK
jgi:hypothetical protein